MTRLAEGIGAAVGSAAILALTGGLIRMALLVRDTSKAAADLARAVTDVQAGQRGHETRLSRLEGWRSAGGGRHR